MQEKTLEYLDRQNVACGSNSVTNMFIHMSKHRSG